MNFRRIDIDFLNCNPKAEITAFNPSPTINNYFTAGVDRNGITNVHSFSEIIYNNIFPNIDLAFYMDNSTGNNTPGIKYNFIIHPGGLIRDIQLLYRGADDVHIDGDSLLIRTASIVFSEQIPSSYFVKDHKKIDIHYYSVANNVFSFSDGKDLPVESDLIIDPMPCLVWGTYYGGSGTENCEAIAIGKNNNVFIIGNTTSPTNIATTGAYDIDWLASADIFVAEMNSSGTALQWGTYYGDSAAEVGYDIALDTSGNIFIVGHSSSDSGIATIGSYDASHNGLSDIVLAKFNPTGSTLIWSTYYGGAGPESGNSIVLDASANVYISGYSGSTNGIATSGAYSTANAGDHDVFLAKFDSTGTSLLWGTYYGGANREQGYALAMDGVGNLYVGGFTMGDSGIASVGAYQTVFAGSVQDAFVAAFNSTGTSLLWGTYLGGTLGESVSAITTNSASEVFVVGSTSSANLATTGAFQQSIGGGSDGYVAKFDPTGSSLIWLTYFGGASFDKVSGILLNNNSLFISGMSNSPNLATVGAYQTSVAGSTDSFIAELSPNGSTMINCSYYGGTAADENYAIAIDTAGDFYIAGTTASPAGIATPGSYLSTFGSSTADQVYIAKFSCFSFSTEVASETTIPCQVFPNPSDGQFTITQNAGKGDVDISVFDLQGRVVFHSFIENGSAESSHYIDLGNQAAGIYLLQINNGDTIMREKLFIH
ncbi:MAG: SBBP repeat-containing protein [Bacteroidota bacterium]|nr:SBBP repeat-containing protein [Bacteroidota bacterium]